MTLIARTGDQLDVDDGPGVELRTISGLEFDGIISFNDRGQLAFTASFTDGTQGIFVSNLVAVPEPATAPLAIIAAAGLIAFVRRKKRRK